MTIYQLAAEKETAEAQRIFRQRLERGTLKREIAASEQSLGFNAGNKIMMKQISAHIDAAKKRIAELTAQIEKRWERPSSLTLDRINSLFATMSGFQSAMAFAESGIIVAVRDEKTKAESKARAELAEAKREYLKAHDALRKAIEKTGLDPTPLCGTKTAKEIEQGWAEEELEARG